MALLESWDMALSIDPSPLPMAFLECWDMALSIDPGQTVRGHPGVELWLPKVGAPALVPLLPLPRDGLYQ